MRHKPYIERDIRQTECLSPILKANGPNLHYDNGKSHNKTFHISCRMPWLRKIIPSTGRPWWYHMAVECSDVGSNSSLELSWFDLSTPGYDLSNILFSTIGACYKVDNSGRSWPTEDPIFLYVPSSNQTCVRMNHLGRPTVRQGKMQNLQNDNPHTDREVNVWGNHQD